MGKIWVLCFALIFILSGCGVSGVGSVGAADDLAAEEEITVPDTERPGATRFIVDIVDLTQEEGIATDAALELFYADEEYEYYFPSVKSAYILVGYSDSGTENIVDAIQNGRVTIENLDYFGIEYIRVPKAVD